MIPDHLNFLKGADLRAKNLAFQLDKYSKMIPDFFQKNFNTNNNNNLIKNREMDEESVLCNQGNPYSNP